MKPSPKQGNKVQFEASWGRKSGLCEGCASCWPFVESAARPGCSKVSRLPDVQVQSLQDIKSSDVHLGTTLLYFKGKTRWTFPVITTFQHPFNEQDCTGPSCQPNKEGAGIYFPLPGSLTALLLLWGIHPGYPASKVKRKSQQSHHRIWWAKLWS